MSKIWKHGKKIKRKRNGIKVDTICKDCKSNSTLYECESIDELKVYGLVKIFDFTQTVMQCGKCDAISKANDQIEVKKAFEERKCLEKKAEEEKQKEEIRKQQLLRQKQEEENRKQLEKKRAAQAEEIDKELEELKKQQDN